MRERLLGAAACALCFSAGAGASYAETPLSSNRPLLAQTKAEWAKDVTALVIAPDGTWGTATEPFPGPALGEAIASCKSKYRKEIGCGYKSTFIREGWSLAIRCGEVNIIVAEKTLRAAEQAAVDSELRLRRDYRPNMPPCVRVVMVDPEGRIIAPDVVHLLRLLMERRIVAENSLPTD